MKHLHVTVVVLFLLIYVIKILLLLFNKNEALQQFSKKIKIPEIIISSLFLLTGIYLWTQTGNVGTWLYLKVIAVLLSIPLAVIGFKKQNKILASLSVLLLVYAYGVSETKSITMKKETRELSKESALNAPTAIADLYTTNCANCHGADGKLGLSGAKDLSVSVFSNEENINIIKNGKGSMLKFDGVLNDADITALSQYITTLRK